MLCFLIFCSSFLFFFDYHIYEKITNELVVASSALQTKMQSELGVQLKEYPFYPFLLSLTLFIILAILL